MLDMILHGYWVKWGIFFHYKSLLELIPNTLFLGYNESKEQKNVLENRERIVMKVFLQKDVVGVGLAGDVVKVTEGYGRNFILPRKLGVEVTPSNENSFAARANNVVRKKEVVETKTSLLAERIKTLQLTLKRKMHDDGKLYGAINQGEVADLLAEKGIKVAKNQIEFNKTIKEKGIHEITVKLSSRLKPTLTLKIVPEATAS